MLLRYIKASASNRGGARIQIGLCACRGAKAQRKCELLGHVGSELA